MFTWFDLPVFDKESQDFFAALILKAIKERQESGEKRNDMIDACLEILKKEKQSIEFEGSLESKDSEITTMQNEEAERILIANALLMFLAGSQRLHVLCTILTDGNL